MKTLRKLLSIRCVECGEVHVWFWRRRCAFCGPGEGRTDPAPAFDVVGE